jgi:hypothetical protein
MRPSSYRTIIIIVPILIFYSCKKDKAVDVCDEFSCPQGQIYSLPQDAATLNWMNFADSLPDTCWFYNQSISPPDSVFAIPVVKTTHNVIIPCPSCPQHYHGDILNGKFVEYLFQGGSAVTIGVSRDLTNTVDLIWAERSFSPYEVWSQPIDTTISLYDKGQDYDFGAGGSYTSSIQFNKVDGLTFVFPPGLELNK